MAEAALRRVEEVVWLLPQAFPHKPYEVTSLDERLQMLRKIAALNARFSVGVTEGGLFIEIARECKAAFGRQVEVFILCGRDAAERAIQWDYGQPGAFARMLKEFQLLVAPRQGRLVPPAELAHRIHSLELPASFEHVSSTEVRRRIAKGEPWEDLVPQVIRPLVQRFYVERLQVER